LGLLPSLQGEEYSFAQTVVPRRRAASMQWERIRRNLIPMSLRTPHADPTEPFVPASTVLLLHKALRPWDVGLRDLLDGIALDEGALDAPGSLLSVRQSVAVVRRARELTNEPGLGIFIGLLTHPNTYGYLSLASQSAATLGETIDLTIRFAPALTTAFSFRLNRVGGIAGLVLEELCDLGDARDVYVLSILIGLRTIACELTGREPWRPIDVAMPEPAYYRRLSHFVPELRFNQPINQIVLLESDLEIPLRMPDRAALRLATEQCESALNMLGDDTSIEQRTLGVVMTEDGPLPFEQVAAALGMSTRTLKRRLAEAHVTFSELVEKARRERALLLLRSRSSPLDDIAERLGYSTVSNLGRAFRRWTGMTPAAYRRQVLGRVSIPSAALRVGTR
jgi:AraC-like DNA-binding protein